MKIIYLLPILLLTGCLGTVPVVHKFPDAPPLLKEKCAPLETINHSNDVSIVEITKSVTNNYTTYHECSIKVDNWIEWYNDQKKIFDKVGK